MAAKGDTPPEVEQTVQEALSKITKDLSEQMKQPNLFTTGDQVNWSDVSRWVPTGSTLMDIAFTSYGSAGEPIGSGLALGRWTELFGWESSGKTTLYTNMIAAIQAIGGIAVILDSEARFYKPRAQRMGVDLSQLIMLDARWVQEGQEGITKFCEAAQENSSLKGRPIIFFWDTIATCPTKGEYDAGVYGGGMADKARVMRTMARDFAAPFGDWNAHLVLVNQLAATMASFGKQSDTGGGGAIKYQSTLRIEVARAGQFVNPEIPTEVGGISSRIKVIKTSLFRPGCDFNLPLWYDTGLDDHLSVVQFHIINKTNAVTVKGGRYYAVDFDSAMPGKYLRDFVKIAKENPDFWTYLVNGVKNNAKMLWAKPAEEKK